MVQIGGRGGPSGLQGWEILKKLVKSRQNWSLVLSALLQGDLLFFLPVTPSLYLNMSTDEASLAATVGQRVGAD